MRPNSRTVTFRFCAFVFFFVYFSGPRSALSIPPDTKFPSLQSQDDLSNLDDSLGSLDRHFNQHLQMMPSSDISDEEYHHIINDYEEIRSRSQSRSNSPTFLERNYRRIAMNQQMMHSSDISDEEYRRIIDDYEEIRSRSNSPTFLQRNYRRIAMNQSFPLEEGIRTQSLNFSDSDDETIAQIEPNGYEPDSDSDITVIGPDDFDGAETELEFGSDEDDEFLVNIPGQ